MFNLLRKVKRFIIFKIKYSIALATHKKRELNYKKKDITNIVFIVQYIPAWNKVKRLYEELKSRDNAQVFILCVPNNIDMLNTDISCCENEVFNYFIANGYEAINAVENDNKWFDLKSISPDYVFHSRPYNRFMPEPYKSYNISKYARICQILYGPSIDKKLMDTTLNYDFFKDVYCYFAFGIDDKTYVESINATGIRINMQKSVKIGVPSLEYIYSLKDTAIDNYPELKSKVRFIWTPRWSTAPKIGGSNFFNYKDIIIDNIKNCDTASLLIRPHPLMFSNFEKTGEYSSDNQTNFRNMCNNSNNIRIDEMKEYFDNFWISDVLITDLSAVMYEYFITGKPIIYCHSDIDIDFVYESKKILDVCYNVYNKKDLTKYITMLKNGEDPLKISRENLINELYFNDILYSSQNIANNLLSN